MDWSRPTGVVVPTLDGPVLRALAGTTAPMTASHIHRLAGTGSQRGVRNVLDRLAHQGLVDATGAGPMTLYALNRDHLAAAAVDVLATLRTELLGRLRSEFDSWRPAPQHAALFGSAARGDGGPDSDVDLLILRPAEIDRQNVPWSDQIESLRERVRAWTGNHAHIVDITRGGLEEAVRSREPIVESWGRDAVCLSGPETTAFLKEAGWHAR